jgi:hypothetical protein
MFLLDKTELRQDPVAVTRRYGKKKGLQSWSELKEALCFLDLVFSKLNEGHNIAKLCLKKFCYITSWSRVLLENLTSLCS